MMENKEIRIGTRASKLAMWQAEQVRLKCSQLYPAVDVQIVQIHSGGDLDRTSTLASMGGSGVFVKELEVALLQDKVDLAVHSAKDMPSEVMDGLYIVSALERGRVEDALISRSGSVLDELPLNALIGTSSPRRKAQLLKIRPDLRTENIRGNVETRLSKVHEGTYDATMLAAAGMDRLGLLNHATQILPVDLFLPAPGQGIVAVECRKADAEWFHPLHQAASQEALFQLMAERAFLRTLGAGCSAAVAGLSWFDEGQLYMRGRVLSLDGKTMLERDAKEQDPHKLGEALARDLLALGAHKLLEEQ